MADAAPTVDSTDAAATLGRMLYEFRPASREQGSRLHRSGAVVELAREGDYSVSATVEEHRRGRHRHRRVRLLRQGEAWSARCTCLFSPHCEHVFAVALAWMAHLGGDKDQQPSGLDPTTATALAASLHPPRPPSFRQQWEPVLAEKLGRPLTHDEGALLGQLSAVFHSFKQTRAVTAWDLARLGFRTQRCRDAPYGHLYEGWWDEPPPDPLSLWQYVAYDIETSGLTVPEFLAPVTDTRPVRERVLNLGRRQAIARWRDRLRYLGQAAAPASAQSEAAAKEQVELRLRLTPERWTLECRPNADAPWNISRKLTIDRIARENAGDPGEFAANAETFAFVALCQQHYRRNYFISLAADQPDARKLLRTLLEHRLTRSLVVDAAGNPLTFSPELVRWRLSRAGDSDRDYELALELPDGRALPPSALHLPGRPDWYLYDRTIYAGPPPLDRGSAAGAIIPLEAIEDPEVVTMLRRGGARLPSEVEERFVSVPLRPWIECALETDFNGREIFTLELSGRSDTPPAIRTWTPAGWVAPKGEPAEPARIGPKIAMFDLGAADGVAALLPKLTLDYDAYRQTWARRVTRTFPEEFVAWREALPPEVEIRATGELASLLGATVRARINVELLESTVHRDWFDLALVLKPEDTTLTADELTLLLKARGKLVRIPGKGWRRLAVEVDEATGAALEEAGFNRDALASAALSGERHRFHALQLSHQKLADRLPEQQAEVLRARAREIARPESAELPAGLKADLRPYQKEGFHFLVFLSSNGLGGVLADDMGLGKTVQTLAWLLWLAERRPAGKPLQVLVVCPKSVVGNWESETAKFAPSLRVVRFSPAESEAVANAVARGPTIAVANYAQLRLNAEFFSAQRWDAVVLDEGQFIKTPTSRVAQIARELPGEHRVVLTGTPIENRLLDLWSLFSFALPGLLGTQAAFKRHFNEENPLALPRLRARVRHFLLRRTKSQVAADLPPRTEEDVTVELEGEQAKLYQAELKRARAQLLKVQTAKQLDKARFNILASLLRLRQICCHPGLVDTTHAAAGSAKLDELMERLEELREEGHQVLVFSQFVQMLEIIRAKLDEAGIGHLMLTGQTEDRDALVREFQGNKDRSVFLLSLKAAGFGLNLTAASYVVLYDPWWNPAVEAQAIDRTHRIGQQVPVIAYRLIARGTVEEKIRALQHEKASLAGAIVQEESLASVLDLDSLRQILS